MRVKPGSTHDLFEEWGVTGATLGVRLDDNQGATSVARTTGFVESPAGSGIYYLSEFTFPDDAGDYVLVFNDDGTTYDAAHVSTRAVVVTSSVPSSDFDGDTYATVDELMAELKIRTPTTDQNTRGENCLLAAAQEIDDEIDLGDTDSLNDRQLAICNRVNLDRAIELWSNPAFGVLSLSVELGAVSSVGRDTWGRYAVRLRGCKKQWGFA